MAVVIPLDPLPEAMTEERLEEIRERLEDAAFELPQVFVRDALDLVNEIDRRVEVTRRFDREFIAEEVARNAEGGDGAVNAESDAMATALQVDANFMRRARDLAREIDALGLGLTTAQRLLASSPYEEIKSLVAHHSHRGDDTPESEAARSLLCMADEAAGS